MSDVDPEIRELALGQIEDDDETQEARYEQELAQGKRYHEYLKYEAEGASTLADLAERLRGLADWFEAREREGFVLEQPVEDGHVFLVNQELLIS